MPWVSQQVIQRKEQVGSVEVTRPDQSSHKKPEIVVSYFYLQGPTLNTFLSPTKCHSSAGRKFTPLTDKG